MLASYANHQNGPSGAKQVRLHPTPKVLCSWHTIHIDITGKLSGKSDREQHMRQ